MTPRDTAYDLVGGEAWMEDKDRIIQECAVRLVSGGEYEALDRAFMAGVEIALGLRFAEQEEDTCPSK